MCVLKQKNFNFWEAQNIDGIEHVWLYKACLIACRASEVTTAVVDSVD